MAKRKFVIIRTRDAGVHVGFLTQHEGSEVVLAKASRLWRWRGANTLNEVAMRGVDDGYSRISEQVPSITIVGVCEVIQCSPEAEANLSRPRWPV